MEWLVIFGLITAVTMLWSRVGTLEKRLLGLESTEPPPLHPAWPPEAESSARAAQPETAAEAPPPSPAVDIPPIAPSWEPAPAPIPLVAEDRVEHDDEPVAQSGFLADRPSFDFEDLFGRQLPIWAGGIALAVAGVFLVRFSVEAGLLTPQVRVALSFLFGLLLLAGAEAAFRHEERVRDPRVCQALAGAGLATLYAGFYLAGTQYGLIGAGGAFFGLALVTAAAIALSFRFGLPSAVLGLVGGFAAPAMVASEEGNVPLLTLYLALITAGLAFTGARQGRPWLGYAALAGGFLWGLALLASDPSELGDVLALGLFLAAMGAALPLLTGDSPARPWVRLGAAGMASLQLASLIEHAGFAPLTWGLYLLLATALAALGWREPKLREASAFAAALGVWLLALWGLPPAIDYAGVVAGFAAIFVAVPLANLWFGRGRRLDLWQLALVVPALVAVIYGQFGEWDTARPEPLLAGVAFALGLAPALAAWREWRLADEAAPVIPLASAAATAFAALLMLVAAWAAPVAGAAVALVLGGLSARRPQAALVNLAWTAALVTLGALAATPNAIGESVRLAGAGDPRSWHTGPPDRWLATLRWLATGLPFVVLARIEPRETARVAAEALAALLAYGLAAQLVPADALAWTAALGAVALCLSLPRRAGAWGALVAVALAWTLVPLFEWLAGGAMALAGDALLLTDMPGWREVMLRLVPFALAAAVAAWRSRGQPEVGRSLLVAAGLASLVAVHVLYKHVFALGEAETFVRLAFAERTVWQALLAGAGLLAAWRVAAAWNRPVAITLLSLSLAHFAWFTLLLHNPLWQDQHVGAWPLANLLLPAYGIAAIALVALRRQIAHRATWIDWTVDAALIALIALFALSELRHAFSGSLLTAAPMTQAEDLLRSLLGIVLAIGFLAWGARTGARSWRVGSLVLMLFAVGKVFLVDAAGLEGLLRVASFMALGFSLIGIGWVYTRQLKAQATT